MEKIKLFNWLLEMDVEQTRNFYSKELELCDCLYCENFREAFKSMDRAVLELFDRLGIHPAKPSELSEFGEVEEGKRLYVGNYHIVGKLIEGEYCTSSTWSKENTAKIGSLTIAFEKDLMSVPNNFPNPVLQLGFEAKVPWVLEEEPDD